MSVLHCPTCGESAPGPFALLGHIFTAHRVVDHDSTDDTAQFAREGFDPQDERPGRTRLDRDPWVRADELLTDIKEQPTITHGAGDGASTGTGAGGGDVP